jgi:hypothetical protein
VNLIPINAPSQTELWNRRQLALSVLTQRPASPETVAVAVAILRGESIETLVQQELARGAA